MDDGFLHDARRAPPPEFARRLRARLENRNEPSRGAFFRRQAAKWLAAAASIAAVSIAFTFPPVRAGAQAFLDLFRVVSFAGVSFDPARVSELKSAGFDLPRLLGEQTEVLTPPSAPVPYATLDEAGAAAGLTLVEPAWLPPGWKRGQITVSGEHAARITADAAKLRELLGVLAIDDVQIPTGLDGQEATVRIHPLVDIAYSNADGSRTANFLQARSPEVSFPDGVDLSALAEIGLRILGLDRNDAYRFAQSFDWRSTLIVPVPVTAATFREVEVGAGHGLMIESSIATAGKPARNLLLWADGDRVFAIGGPLRSVELLEMAQTAQ
jgi:hypothetical protein